MDDGISGLTPNTTYHFRVVAYNSNGYSYGGDKTFTSLITGITNNMTLPSEFSLEQNYPNPFNPHTTISYSLPEKGHVVLKVYNILREEIGILVNEPKEPGYHTVTWDGKDNNGNSMPNGLYIYTIKASEFKDARKLILLK
ncbi:MAG: FlgD immunoglobulin-like domain containing protein [bacterium]